LSQNTHSEENSGTRGAFDDIVLDGNNPTAPNMVVDRCQAVEQGLIDLEEVVQVAERIRLAGDAIAESRDRAGVLDVFVVLIEVA
jgi:hypothetical protein